MYYSNIAHIICWRYCSQFHTHRFYLTWRQNIYWRKNTFCTGWFLLVGQWWRWIKCMTLTLALRPGRGNEEMRQQLCGFFQSSPLNSTLDGATLFIMSCLVLLWPTVYLTSTTSNSLTPENLWHSLCPWLQVVSFYSEREDQWIWYITAQKFIAHNWRNNPRNILSSYLWVNFSDDCWKWLSPVNLFLGPRKPFDNWRRLTGPGHFPRNCCKMMKNGSALEKLTAIQLLQCWKIEVFMQSESYETLHTKSCFYLQNDPKTMVLYGGSCQKVLITTHSNWVLC